MLKDGSATDPLCRVLGRFRIQPWQEDHRTDRPQNSLRAVAPMLFVELSDILVAQNNAAAPSSTHAQGLAEIMERDVACLIQGEQHGSAVLVVARLARDRGRQ